MTNAEIQKADLLDIIFEHRNKAYGAYALRRDYNHRLLRAIVITFAGAGLLFSLNSWSGPKQQVTALGDKDSVILRIMELPKEKPKEPEAQKPKPSEAVRQIKSVDNIVIVPDDSVTDMPELDQLETSVVSNQTVDGREPADPNEKAGLGTDPGTGKEPAKPEPPQELGPSFAPSFPGGAEAMTQFLRRHLRTFDELEPGTKVTVLIRFMVDTDGRISQYQILQSGGREMDEEVIRVVKKMPAWNPGQQNGHAISMYFTQPVIFMGVEE